ncbi:bifunctional DNA primase/polymerase [Actinokineospora sp. HUAS TT18]|uniref:bifunctional DNA primase/polymerase n=1 Tax=Actinokineospora sp. HUAS TT18 TaxID=3447451 RepID=UPI003F528E07
MTNTTRRPRRGARATTNTRLLNAALSAARAGHHIFPLWPRTKIPALHGEHRCPGTAPCANGHLGWEQRATRDPATIRTWWADRLYNIAIATGPSGLHILDLDPARGTRPPEPWTDAHHGRDVLARLAADASQPYPADTFTVRTPTGGEHLYYRAPEHPPLRNTAGRLGWHIDSRGEGGYIVAPGSLIGHDLYRVTRDRPIAPLPSWLIPLLLPPPIAETPQTRTIGAPTEHRLRAYVQSVADHAATAPDGQRHHNLLRAACTLGRLIAGGDLTEDDARTALHEAAARLTGFPNREAERTINDGLRYGARYPRRLG